MPRASNFQLAGVSIKPEYLDSKRVALAATPMDVELGIAGANILTDLLSGKPEKISPTRVGSARFIRPSFPYLAHPQNTLL